MKDNKKFLQIFSIVALMLAVIGISVGFAAMSTQLQITGTAKVVPAKWEVKFTGQTFSNNSTSASEGKTPSLTDTLFSNYEIVLTKPGDKGTYTVNVKNNGDIDAKISTVSLGTASYSGANAADEALVESNVTYNVTWSNGDPISVNDELAHGADRDIIVEVEYDSEATALPSAPVTISGRDLTVLFVQK